MKKSARQTNRERFDGRPGRTIVVNNVRWKWFTGNRCCNIVAYSEHGDKITSPSWKVNHTHPSNEDKFPVTPHNVEQWLANVKT